MMMVSSIKEPFRGVETPKGLILIATGAIRRQGTAVISLPYGRTVQDIWLFFGSEKRKLYSPDQYFKL